MKIHSMKMFKYVDGGFELDHVNIRRVCILLLFMLTVIFSGLIKNIDTFIIQDSLATSVDMASVVKRPKPIDSTTRAIENYIAKEHGSKLTKSETRKYADLIVKYSKEQGIDPFTWTALIEVESTFNKYAISRVGALGLTQIMPEWHEDKIERLVERFGDFNPFDPEHNIALGTMIFSKYKSDLKGSTNKALLKYNGSLGHPGPTYAKLVMNAREKVRDTSGT